MNNRFLQYHVVEQAITHLGSPGAEASQLSRIAGESRRNGGFNRLTGRYAGEPRMR